MSLLSQLNSRFQVPSSSLEIKVRSLVSNQKCRVETQIKFLLSLNSIGLVDVNNLLLKSTLESTSNLLLDALVVSVSNPDKVIDICENCFAREVRRNKNATKQILIFNVKNPLDFSNGDVFLPTRITCYSRHHNENVGFCVYFIIKDENNSIIASGISPPILITDDHKSEKKSAVTEVFLDDTFFSNDINTHLPSPRSDELMVRTSRADSTLSLDTLANPIEQPIEPTAFDLIEIPPADQLNFEASSFTDMFPINLISQTWNHLSGSEQGVRKRLRSTLEAQDSILASPKIPTIGKVIPNEGPLHGGIEVTILGQDFHGNLI